MEMPWGTLVNVLAVLAGGGLGLLLRSRFTQRYETIVFQGIGLFVLLIGLKMAWETQNPLLMLIALVSGALVGEWLRLESRMEAWSEGIKQKFGQKEDHFNAGLITAFLLFCMGSMTVVGALNEGMNGDRELLYTKSLMDGISALVLASSLGVGVLFSVIPMLLFQGGITLLAGQIKPWVSEVMVQEIAALGGLMIVAIGINILGMAKIRVMHLLPGLITVILLQALQAYFL